MCDEWIKYYNEELGNLSSNEWIVEQLKSISIGGRRKKKKA